MPYPVRFTEEWYWIQRKKLNLHPEVWAERRIFFDRLLDDLVAAADCPKPVLFGMSPAGGLSESGKFEDKLWASTIERYQSHSLKRALTQYFNVILSMRAGPHRRQCPDSMDSVFPSVFRQL